MACKESNSSLESNSTVIPQTDIDSLVVRTFLAGIFLFFCFFSRYFVSYQLSALKKFFETNWHFGTVWLCLVLLATLLPAYHCFCQNLVLWLLHRALQFWHDTQDWAQNFFIIATMLVSDDTGFTSSVVCVFYHPDHGLTGKQPEGTTLKDMSTVLSYFLLSQISYLL